MILIAAMANTITACEVPCCHNEYTLEAVESSNFWSVYHISKYKNCWHSYAVMTCLGILCICKYLLLATCS